MSFIHIEEEKPKKPKKVRAKAKPKVSCEACGLSEGDLLPKMGGCGKFRKKILIINSDLSDGDYSRGKPYTCADSDILSKLLLDNGIKLDIDCKIVNALDCYTDKPTNKRLKCCFLRKEAMIQELKPKLIMLLGKSAVEGFFSNMEVLRNSTLKIPVTSYYNKLIPFLDTGSWVYCMPDMAYVESNKDFIHIIERNLKKAFWAIKKQPRPVRKLTDECIELIERDDDRVIEFLNDIRENKRTITYDYETSSYRYHERIHEIYIMAITLTDLTTMSFPVTSFVKPHIVKVMEDPDVKKIAHNLDHEMKANHYVLDSESQGHIYCSMNAAHILDDCSRITSLKAQSFLQFGEVDYSDEIKSYLSADPGKKNKLSEVPFEKVALYCGRDARNTMALALHQQPLLRPFRKAYNLFQEGILSFNMIERNGIHIDKPKAVSLYADWGLQIEQNKKALLTSPEVALFESKEGRVIKYEKKLSDKDLRALLFDYLKLKPGRKTGTGLYSVDEPTLKLLAPSSPFIQRELETRKLNKLRNVYLKQFLDFEVGGFIYPHFNLHIPRSYRSSSSDPNFQNIPNPKRDPGNDNLKEIRSIIIPRSGRVLVEVDYASMEVRILACKSHDPVLIEYIEQGGDMHGDFAEILYNMSKEAMGDMFKALRFNAKNQFIFPEFYGSYWRSIARDIEIPEDFFPSLKGQVRRYNKWELHIKNCEEIFWKKYKRTREWQNEVLAAYRHDGYIDDGAWGFRATGFLTRNMLYNFPIQGSAYHCLQWTINELVHREKIFDKWESLLCAQIHDALFLDAVSSELPMIQKTITEIMTVRVREQNPWIIIPLEAEWSIGETSWAEMEDIKE